MCEPIFFKTAAQFTQELFRRFKKQRCGRAKVRPSAAYFAGVLRIAFGTYLEAFIISGILLIIAAIMVLFVGAGGRIHQREIVATSPL
jgi:hypothetical protein